MARLEIEHGHQGGAENGNLIVTYDQFVAYGIHRHAIAPAIRELEQLGFMEVVKKGCALNGSFRQPSRYRITYLRAKGAEGDGTHEWRLIKTVDEAEERARQARLEADHRARSLGKARSQKQNASAGFRHSTSAGNRHRKCRVPVTETVTTTPVTETGTAI